MTVAEGKCGLTLSHMIKPGLDNFGTWVDQKNVSSAIRHHTLLVDFYRLYWTYQCKINIEAFLACVNLKLIALSDSLVDGE